MARRPSSATRSSWPPPSTTSEVAVGALLRPPAPASSSGRPRSIAGGFDEGRQRQELAGLLHRRPATASASSSTSCTTGAIYTTALDRDGKQLWQTKVTDYVLHQGFGSSPARLRVAGDRVGRQQGRRRASPASTAPRARSSGSRSGRKLPNYASPIILNVAGRDQLLLTGCDLVTSLDPLTGKKLWEIKGSTDGVRDLHRHRRPAHLHQRRLSRRTTSSAVRADGSGKVAWENSTRVYVPSMLVHDGHLYAVHGRRRRPCAGSATPARKSGRAGSAARSAPRRCWSASTSSPPTKPGRTFIFKATPAGFDIVAENQLGDEVLATPAICGGRIYMRVAVQQQGPAPGDAVLPRQEGVATGGTP